MVLKEDGYKYAVEGFDKFYDVPLFTNCTKTEAGALKVKEDMVNKGLNVIIRPIEFMCGKNPYFEKEE